MRILRSVLAILIPGVMLSPALAQLPTKVMTPPRPPGKSLPSGPVAGRVVHTFPARGVESVYLRAEAADRAEVRTVPGRSFITVSGLPEGDARGYHPADPNWRETPAALWGLDFAARSHGSAMVISSVQEIRYIHHFYHLTNVLLEVPEGVKVVKEKRELTGDGTPNLAAPDRKRG